MEDMGMTAKLFETSSKLRLASSSLDRIASGDQLDNVAIEALTWAGRFLSAVDWSSAGSGKSQVGGGLALQATSVRPTFYSSILRIAPMFKEAGMKGDKDVMSFLGLLYANLLSPGAPGRGRKRLNPAQARLAARLLHEVSQSILVQLNNNGLPRSTSSLRDDWKPTGKIVSDSIAVAIN